MFEKNKKREKYSKSHTKKWLILLAQKMKEDSIKIFLIEKMQPN